ncbi:MAG: Gfo/Idh/MocA family oxidoreductase [Kiritimatiellae bacterium]|nr:Gfo/Idh/MocA family oxidoreductase [Kiritimatiellia bacterium]MBQ3342736.1 Gfo/Idh/MocA family oxidoreductase [Kiritimatiellia bacterium]MBQ6330164.1 Gfo/Idh/MocA family oxidoreductase [Kiritimatiellia bacterium]
MMDNLGNKYLKLGVIGLSEGNGHPYSWSAIFNGCDMAYMKDCGFPVIPEYLSRQKFPDDCIPNAHVTHIWTQDRAVSEHVARASLIPNVVNRMEDMIGQVDAVLLARDDPENHYAMAKPFIEAGLPIYIDKPLAKTIREAEEIYALEKYPGQMFTCSALAYSDGLNIGDIGDIRHIQAFVIKDWKKYAIHVVEPALHLFDWHAKIASHNVIANDTNKIVSLSWANGMTSTFTTLYGADCGFRIQAFGTNGHAEVDFGGTFFMFRNALKAFVGIVRGERKNESREITMKVMDILERGNRG